jgi:hypothetical protein
MGQNYFQEFILPTNYFPARMNLKLDTKKLIPGEDYLVEAYSSSIDATLEVMRLTEEILTDKKAGKAFRKIDLRNKALIVPPELKKSEAYALFVAKAPIVARVEIHPVEKLGAWSPSADVYPITHIRILKTHLEKDPARITLSVKAEFEKDYRSQNVIGYVKGSVHPDSFFVFTAHYDHLGRMGKNTMFPGANDNASGTSLMLNLAAYYASDSVKPEYSMLFIAFAAEEIGLIGSKYFVELPLVPLKKMRFLINMDLMGTGSEGMMVVNGKHFTAPYDALVAINDKASYLPVIKARGKAKNSDHYWFTEQGVPSFFFYLMGGPKFYHDIYDKAETLPLTKYAEVFRLITEFVEELER